MNLIDRAKQIVNGARVLADWIGDGGTVVPQLAAQDRADTCLKCPLHTGSGGIAESAAAALKQQLEIKNHLQMRVKGEKSLHTCSACGCAMRLKIWLPIQKIAPEAGERQNFDANCWLLKES